MLPTEQLENLKLISTSIIFNINRRPFSFLVTTHFCYRSYLFDDEVKFKAYESQLNIEAHLSVIEIYRSI